MSAQSKTVYPLSWPARWPKTEANRRETARFQSTLASALNNLKKQVELLGGSGLVLSSNYTLGSENPRDPGVVAFFKFGDNADVAIPCDRWNRIEHNVQAIARTIEAMRGMNRWGAKHMIKAMFTGFKQLPEGSEWWRVLNCQPDASLEEIKSRYRELSKLHHPDVGGNAATMAQINDAYKAALQARVG